MCVWADFKHTGADVSLVLCVYYRWRPCVLPGKPRRGADIPARMHATIRSLTPSSRTANGRALGPRLLEQRRVLVPTSTCMGATIHLTHRLGFVHAERGVVPGLDQHKQPGLAAETLAYFHRFETPKFISPDSDRRSMSTSAALLFY